MRDEASVVWSLRVVSHRHLLSRGPGRQFRLDLAPARLALRATTDRHRVGSRVYTRNLASRVFVVAGVHGSLHLFLLLLLLLLLDIVVMTRIAVELRATRASILIKALAACTVSWISFVDSERIHLWVLWPLMSVWKCVLLDMIWIDLRIFLWQVELTIHIEVINLLQRHPVLSPLRVILVVIRASLTVGSFLFDDELLTWIGIYLVYLWQLLLLLVLLKLRLLLFVLF